MSEEKQTKFSISMEVAISHEMEMGGATLEYWVKGILAEEGIKVVYIDASEVDEFEYGQGDEWGRR